MDWRLSHCYGLGNQGSARVCALSKGQAWNANRKKFWCLIMVVDFTLFRLDCVPVHLQPCCCGMLAIEFLLSVDNEISTFPF